MKYLAHCESQKRRTMARALHTRVLSNCFQGTVVWLSVLIDSSAFIFHVSKVPTVSKPMVCFHGKNPDIRELSELFCK